MSGSPVRSGVRPDGGFWIESLNDYMARCEAEYQASYEAVDLHRKLPAAGKATPEVVDAMFDILEKHSKDEDGGFLAGDAVRCNIITDLVALWERGPAPPQSGPAKKESNG